MGNAIFVLELGLQRSAYSFNNLYATIFFIKLYTLSYILFVWPGDARPRHIHPVHPLHHATREDATVFAGRIAVTALHLRKKFLLARPISLERELDADCVFL